MNTYLLIRPAVCTALMMLTALSSQAELLAPKVYSSEYPPKDKRMLITDDEIVRVRNNINEYAKAKGIAEGIIAKANVWVEWSDEELHDLIPTADVTRAFNVGTAGCPKCGKEIYSKNGTYPWKVDPAAPFKVTCPVDGSTYPSNDYTAYYASGLEDNSLLTGDFADDGRGWLGPNGERYWFVAYANHWNLQNNVIPATQTLGRAYILTGDKKYAHKATILLDRFAEVYPNMDYHSQSRYGAKQAVNGSRYEGKMVNWIWATGNLMKLAEAYDFVWETIDDNSVPSKTAKEVCANIEANLLEEGIRGYFSGTIRGNFGMHQRTLVYAGLARQYGEQDTWFDGLLNDAGSNYRMTGLNYALYNLVYRDGTPYETSSSYNFSWVVSLTTVAVALDRAGYDVFAIPKMRSLYNAPLELINLSKFTPALGDSNSVYGGMIGRNAFVYQTAWRIYKDSRYLQHLQSFGAVGEKSFTGFASLLYPPIEAVEIPKAPVKSRLLDGYGMAILSNPADTVSLSLYYGYKGGHGHMDRLHFSLFANGQPMMPDTGYPDFMNAYVPGIYTWTKNTITHNTLTVDASMQRNNYPGRVNLFVDDGIARAFDIDAADTYDTTSEYRRRMMMIDFDDEHSYIIDCFTVKGGTQHDYSLHGPPGTFKTLSGDWSDPAQGTLAGEDVPLGFIYDDLALTKKGYTGGYSRYKGSGFQHLQHVQHLKKGTVATEWTHEKDATAKLRIYQPNAASETFLADAQVSPVKQKKLLKYLIAREKGEALDSTFVSVIEPFSGASTITDINIHLPTEGEGRVLEIFWKRDDGIPVRDLVVINTGDGILKWEPENLVCDGAFGLIRTVDEESENNFTTWMSNGKKLSNTSAGMGLSNAASTGEVTKIDLANSRVHVRMPIDDAGYFDHVRVGRIVHFENELRRTSHTITAIEKSPEGVILTLRDDLRIGHVLVDEVVPGGLKTKTGLAFSRIYGGAYVTNAKNKNILPISGVHKGIVQWVQAEAQPSTFNAGDEAWIVDVGPGDRMEIPSVKEEGM